MGADAAEDFPEIFLFLFGALGPLQVIFVFLTLGFLVAPCFRTSYLERRAPQLVAS